MDPVRSPLPPVAQFLAEAALQRQGSLLGLDRAQPVATPPGSPPPLPSLLVPPASAAIPLPVRADKASISAQAREQLGAGFDPQRPAGAAAASAPAGTVQGGVPQGSAQAAPASASPLRPPAPPPLPTGAPAGAARHAAARATAGSRR